VAVYICGLRGETNTKATNAINNVKLWLNNNKFTLNKIKTEIMTFSLKANGQPRNLDVIIHNQTKCTMTVTVTLSQKRTHIVTWELQIDEHLRWDKHAQLTATRIRKTLKKIIRLRLMVKDFMTRHTAICVIWYFSLERMVLRHETD